MADVELVLCDCLEYMRGMEAGSVDAVVTDPPYSEQTHAGMRSMQANGHAESSIDFDSWSFADIRAAMQMCGRLTRRWIVSFMDYRHAVALELDPPRGLEFVRLGVWVKRNGMRQLTADRPAMGWEAIAFLHSVNVPKRWNGGGSHAVYDHMTVRAGRFVPNFHPTEKPVELVSELIRLFTDPGDLVFDPFAGSGTTAVACIQTGRRFVGCEISPEYFEIARRRIADAQARPRLFEDAPTPVPQQAHLLDAPPPEKRRR